MCPLKNNKNMNMRLKVIIVVFCLVGLNIYAQNSVNAYKYIIVPKKFDFQKAEIVNREMNYRYKKQFVFDY